MIKDYYQLLGIPRNESAAGIRAAYRDLAKQCHPDISGEPAAGRFREILEAYQVLSDPARRKRYNHELAESERTLASSVLRPWVEPIVSQAPSIFSNPENIRPAFDELFDRYFRNYTGISIPKSEHEEGLNIEIVLTTDEASRGGVLPVAVPVYERCPVCFGTGEDWFFQCLECHAQGMIERREILHVRIPPGIRPGTVIELPLRGLGVHNFYLRVHLFVSEH